MMDANVSYALDVAGQHVLLTANEPVLVMQLSLDEDDDHSPASFIVPPIEHFRNSYTVPVPRSVTADMNFFQQIFLIFTEGTRSFMVNGFSFSIADEPQAEFIGHTEEPTHLFSYRLPFSRPVCQISSEDGMPFGFILYANGVGGKCSVAFSVDSLSNYVDEGEGEIESGKPGTNISSSTFLAPTTTTLDSATTSGIYARGGATTLSFRRQQQYSKSLSDQETSVLLFVVLIGIVVFIFVIVLIVRRIYYQRNSSLEFSASSRTFSQ